MIARCQNCGAVAQPDDSECPYCGAPGLKPLDERRFYASAYVEQGPSYYERLRRAAIGTVCAIALVGLGGGTYAVVSLLDGPVSAQVAGNDGLSGILRGKGGSAAPPPIFQMAYLTSGPLIADDANTVAHVTWNGTALVDSKGNTWTMNGTVPQVTGAQASPLFPSGFTAAPRSGAGPYSASNYYSLGTGSPFNFSGDWSMCVVYKAVSETNGTLVRWSNQPAINSYNYSGSQVIILSIDGTNNLFSTTAMPIGGVSVACMGRSGGTTAWVKVNLSAVQTATQTNVVYSGAAEIGAREGGGLPAAGTIYEIWASTDTPSDALFTAIQQRVLNEVAGTGQVIADTRSTAATYYTNDTRWIAPVNIPRIEQFTDGGGGILTEIASTNYLLNSETPATQTTASLGTGPYTGSTLGTGGVTFAAATATATGLPCTTSTFLDVGEGGDCHFTITVAGTVLATVVGSVTHEQLEGLAFRTSDIITGGTAVTRAADSISSTFAYTLGATSFSESADALYFGQTAGAQQTLIAAKADSTDLWYLNLNATPAASLNGYFSSTSHLAASSGSPPSGLWYHYLGTYDGAHENACLNGACTPAAFSFSAPTSFASVSIGVDPQATTGPLNGLLRNVCVGLKGACQ